MITETEVKAKLAALLDDTLALEDFEDWIVGHSYNMHLDSTPETQELVESVLSFLDEYTDDAFGYAALRARLRGLLHVSTHAPRVMHPVRLLPEVPTKPEIPVTSSTKSRLRPRREVFLVPG